MKNRKGAPDAPGMRGHRSRTKAGPLREKRGDTLNRTIERKYDIDTGLRGDAHLDTVLERHKVNSLNDLIKKLK
ncbi:MAG: hypothetical protein ACR2H4_19665 [Pyrinomonadaceae bacterium]